MLSPTFLFCVNHSPLIPVFHILFLLPLLDPLLFDTSPGGIKKANLADDLHRPLIRKSSNSEGTSSLAMRNVYHSKIEMSINLWNLHQR